MRKKTRFAVIALMVVALMCVFAVPTFASVHVSDWTVSSATMTSLSLESTGDAGQSHGNRNDGTSPIAPAVDPNSFFWFNQDVRVFDPAVVDPDADDDIVVTGGFWQLSTDNVTWGPSHNTSFAPTDTPTVSAEGLYSVTATGFDGDDSDELATGTVTPAFGIDKTKPSSWTDLPAVPGGDSDAIPVLSGDTAMVTISATDTLSGVENLQYSADGAPLDYAWDADPGGMFTVPVTFTPGFHTLSWHVFDNAGNVDSHSVMFFVRPSVFTPSVSLTVNQSGSRSRTVRFRGEVDAISTSAPVKLTVQRWNGKRYVSFMTISKTLPKFFDDYSVTVKINRAARFSVTSTFAGGTSKTRYFRTR